MAQHKFIAYYRVSTQKQGASGLGLDAQREAVKSYLRGCNGKLTAAYTEIESGKRSDRPELLAALAQCRLHKATLIIAKLDRLARNVAFIANLMESGVEFVAVDFPQANRLTVHILAAIAEHEALMISQRTRAALQAARRRGIRLGGLRSNSASMGRSGAAASASVRQAKAGRRNADLLPVVQRLKATGATLATIAERLNGDGIPAPRGGYWHPASVARVLAAA